MKKFNVAIIAILLIIAVATCRAETSLGTALIGWNKAPYTIVFMGDSVTAAYAGASAVPVFVDTSLYKYTMAVPGHTITQQRALWVSYGDKDYVRCVVIQLGLNDLSPSTQTPTIISALQELVDYVGSTAPNAKIVISKMTPAKQRYVVLFGESGGATVLQQWRDINVAIAGDGATPITRVDARVTSHAVGMSDGNENLNPSYDTGDYIHPNNAGRAINAAAIESALQSIGP